MSFYKSLLFIVSLVSLSFSLLSAQPDREKLEKLSRLHLEKGWASFRELLSLPNDARQPAGIEQNVQWMEHAFTTRDFKTSRLSTPGAPLLLATREGRNPKRTVLIYLQIDGQPVDSTRWFQASPWTPVLKEKSESGSWEEIPWERLNAAPDNEWRIFARSASDAKGPVAMFLTALDAMLAEKMEPDYNIKVIMDFEEELGSPNLPGAVSTHREKLKSDMLIIFDGPRHISNKPSLTFGARGIATIQLVVHGPRVPQHSGHFGNYAPNPALRLAQLLASMKDDDGRVTIPGFYDGIELDEASLAILARVPDDEAEIQQKIGIAAIDKVSDTYQKSIQYPSLNIRGLASGWVKQKVRTIIPATAIAEIDVRLVPESNPERLISLIRNHIVKQGFHIIDGEPTEQQRRTHSRIASFKSTISYKAFRTPFDSEVGQWLTRAYERAFEVEPIRKRMSGGSIPISPFITTLGIPAVTVPTVNSDNNQHSPNENLRVGNFIDGVKTFLAILTEKF